MIAGLMNFREVCLEKRIEARGGERYPHGSAGRCSRACFEGGVGGKCYEVTGTAPRVAGAPANEKGTRLRIECGF